MFPSLKVTVPVGVTVPDPAVTAAVNVTAFPNTDGLRFEETTVVETAQILGQTARILNVQRTTLIEKIQKFGLRGD